MDEIKFGGTIIKIDGEVCSKITSFTRSVTIAEEDVTGAEDVVAGSDILDSQFVSISKGETADVEGISIESASSGMDIGQSDLKDAAESGKTVVIEHTRPTGYGYNLTGFFTSYEESGDTSGVYKFKGSFRINIKTEITPGS
jgi:hypothetical protein